ESFPPSRRSGNPPLRHGPGRGGARGRRGRGGRDDGGRQDYACARGAAWARLRRRSAVADLPDRAILLAAAGAAAGLARRSLPAGICGRGRRARAGGGGSGRAAGRMAGQAGLAAAGRGAAGTDRGGRRGRRGARLDTGHTDRLGRPMPGLM
ncbi:MAG: tRNA threonylcarbamoyladenosine biosynthesis protein TsaE, partial [uncultured Sphingomonadaceae bacterium]